MRLALSPDIRYVGRLAYTPEDFSSYFLNGKDIQLTLEGMGRKWSKHFHPLQRKVGCLIFHQIFS